MLTHEVQPTLFIGVRRRSMKNGDNIDISRGPAFHLFASFDEAAIDPLEPLFKPNLTKLLPVFQKAT